MKKIILATCILIGFLFETSAQSKFEKMFWSKKYKASLAERDEICAANKKLRSDTLELGHAYRKLSASNDSLILAHGLLTQTNNELQARYQYLSETSDQKLAALSRSLDAKSKELNLKEKNLQEKDQKLRELQKLISRQDSVLNYLNTTVKNALLGFKSDEFGVEMKNGKVYVSLSDKLLFKSGSANVEDKGKEAIKKLSEVLSKNSDIDIAIEGHTDNVPIKTAIYKDNWDLSVARSVNIVRMICDEFHVDSKRVTASGKGEYFPVANNETAEGRAKNRRTEIVLSPKLEELFKILNTKN